MEAHKHTAYNFTLSEVELLKVLAFVEKNRGDWNNYIEDFYNMLVRTKNES